jgi:hypothetical protein
VQGILGSLNFIPDALEMPVPRTNGAYNSLGKSTNRISFVRQVIQFRQHRQAIITITWDLTTQNPAIGLVAPRSDRLHSAQLIPGVFTRALLRKADTAGPIAAMAALMTMEALPRLRVARLSWMLVRTRRRQTDTVEVEPQTRSPLKLAGI